MSTTPDLGSFGRLTYVGYVTQHSRDLFLEIPRTDGGKWATVRIEGDYEFEPLADPWVGVATGLPLRDETGRVWVYDGGGAWSLIWTPSQQANDWPQPTTPTGPLVRLIPDPQGADVLANA